MNRREALIALVTGALCSCQSTLTTAGVADNLLEDFGDDKVEPAVATDVILEAHQFQLLNQIVRRLRRLQSYVGFGNFNLVSFDQALRYARNQSSIGAFTPAEIAFLEEIFFADAARYGFLGDKVFTQLTTQIPKRVTHKVPRSGHYLYKGRALELFYQIRKEVGDSLILTSGIRGIVKQMYLFLAKTAATEGNLSIASRSIAPPGYSYHSIGDFDIGKRGLGVGNFTEVFAKTDEYKRLHKFISIRYPKGNPYGVRYEPWHIKVV